MTAPIPPPRPAATAGTDPSAPTAAHDPRPHVVIVGGGFAGLYAARTLAGAAVRITLVDRRNHHLFQPLLYQVATAGLAAPDIAAPIRRVLRKQRNATVLLGKVTAIDPSARSITLDGHERLDYDYLLLAAGMRTAYFGNDALKAHAPGLKSIEDAFEMRRRILLAFEHAERERDPAQRARDLRFVIVGGGPTGVELAGALREIAMHTLAADFRNCDPASAEVVLIDGADRVLPSFPPDLSQRALAQLADLDVRVRSGEFVASIDERGVELASGERIEARTVLWAAGVEASPLAAQVGGERTRDGRVIVGPDLSLPDHPELFVLGDLAAVRTEDGDWVPGMAPGAIQMGQHAARAIRGDLNGAKRLPFRYRHKGLLATIGRSAAVAEVGGRHFGGFLAWLMWVFVHVFWLIGFRERLVVLAEWAWAWLTWQRAARVIVDPRPHGRAPASPTIEEHAPASAARHP